ncbi:MAG: glycosyltransferase family 4 protein [Acidimicrobiia bacterium]|nr:glycosyltransferase family 4 protein [Acidimicrobiia bacterium]MDH5238046.1 glycosyltransferase family 4 protein [Acidimicrobiia bacterium]
MRVVQFVSDADRRGAQVFAVALGSALAGRGVAVDTFALVPGTSADPLPIPVLSPSSRWWGALGGVRRAAFGADVVIAHGSSTLPACAVAVGRRAPFVYRSIGDLPQWVGGGLRRRRVSWALGRAAGVSVLWPDLVSFLTGPLGVDEARVRVLPNAVETARFPEASEADREAARLELGIGPHEVVIAHVGALADEKRIAWLVEVAARRQWSLVLAGSGPERDRLSALARARAANVSFLGPRADPWPVYAAADVVALASRTEGQPAVLIEAALCARAVVAPRLGGIPELVDDGRTGVLFAADAGPAGLEDALDEALGRADQLGSAAAAWARPRFDIEASAATWHEWLSDLAVA